MSSFETWGGFNPNSDKFTIKGMLDFLENEYTNDFGIQWNDTTCDWNGWLGYSLDNSFKTYLEDTLFKLLKSMVESIKI